MRGCGCLYVMGIEMVEEGGDHKNRRFREKSSVEALTPHDDFEIL